MFFNETQFIVNLSIFHKFIISDLDEDSNDYAEDSADSDSSEGLSGEDKPDNENSLGSFTFNRKERLDVKKPGPFFRNSENNFFFNKVITMVSDDLHIPSCLHLDSWNIYIVMLDYVI